MAKKIIPYEDVDYFNGLKKQAEENSKAWHETDNEDTRAGLNRANQMLYSKMDDMTGGKSYFDANTGRWSTAYNDSTESANAWKTDGAPTQKQFTSPWTSKINDTLTEIEKSGFSYNPNSDPSYKAYADMYKREGDRAVKSTLADIATAQGGVSSYAGQAAQQAANYYSQQLTDRIPELEALAYQKYNADLNNKYSALDRYMNMENADYNKFIDNRNYMDYLDEVKYQREQDAYNRNYKEEKDAWDRQYQTDMFNYEKGQTALENENNYKQNLISMIMTGYQPTEAELARAGFTPEYVNILQSKAKFEALASVNPDLAAAMVSGGAVAAVDPFGVYTGGAHGTSGQGTYKNSGIFEAAYPTSYTGASTPQPAAAAPVAAPTTEDEELKKNSTLTVEQQAIYDYLVNGKDYNSYIANYSDEDKAVVMEYIMQQNKKAAEEKAQRQKESGKSYRQQLAEQGIYPYGYKEPTGSGSQTVVLDVNKNGKKTIANGNADFINALYNDIIPEYPEVEKTYPNVTGHGGLNTYAFGDNYDVMPMYGQERPVVQMPTATNSGGKKSTSGSRKGTSKGRKGTSGGSSGGKPISGFGTYEDEIDYYIGEYKKGNISEQELSKKTSSVASAATANNLYKAMNGEISFKDLPALNSKYSKYLK